MTASTLTHDRRGPGLVDDPAGRRPAANRRRWWTVMAGGLTAVATALAWGLNAAGAMVEEVDGWARGEAPGAVQVEVDEPGELVVRSETTGFVRWGLPAGDLEVTVTDPDGDPVPVADAAGAGQYRVPGRQGRAVATFQAERSGSHEVAVDAPEGATFAVGEPLWPDALGGIVGAAVLGVSGLLALAGGAVGLVVTRGRADGASPGRRRARPLLVGGRRHGGGPGLGRMAAYAALALGLTWAVWIPALTLLGDGAVPFVLLGAFGPAVAAAVMVRAEGGRVRSWLRRIFVLRLPVRWYLVALAVPLLEPATVTAVAVAHGEPLALAELPARLPAVLAGFVVVLLVGGGQEELGWRGYLLPRLQARVGALGASLAIGVLWAVWHLPLFTLGMPGYTYERVSFLVYLPLLMAASVAFTWLFNHTRGSVVPVMLLHAAFNSWDNLTPLPASIPVDGQVEAVAQVALVGVYALLAVALLRTAGRRLGARPSDQRAPTIQRPRATRGQTGA